MTVQRSFSFLTGCLFSATAERASLNGMPAPPELQMRYLFEDYALDTDRRELSRRGDLVRLETQAFDLLEYLMRNRERVFSRDDLIEAIWRAGSSPIRP